MKVLVCGSRDWTDEKVIERELKTLPHGTVVIHGACPTGADALADKIAMKLGLKIRRYPANWDEEGKKAGPIRNATMIREEHRAGDPLSHVLAFTKDLARSRGTKDCAERARKAGVRVVVVGQ